MTSLDWLKRAKARLWELGWSYSRMGLWYRPFPRNRKAGLTIFQAAKEVGFDDPEEEVQGQGTQTAGNSTAAIC